MGDRSIHDVLTRLRSLFDASGIPSPDDLDIVAGKLADQRPVVIDEHPAIKIALERGTEPVRFQLARLFMLPWEIYEPALEGHTLIVRDIRNDARSAPLPVIREIPVSRFGAEVDMDHSFILGGEKSFTTISYNNYSWTLFHGPSSANREDTGNDEEAINTPLPTDSNTVAFIPSSYWNDPLFRGDMTVDTYKLLRSFMEEALLYRSKAVFTDNIRLYNIRSESGGLSTVHTGYGVRPLESEGWIPLLMTAPVVGARHISPGSLNPNIPPEIAQEAQRNLEIVFYALKEMGVAMRSWTHTMVNPNTGEISLGEGDMPELMNATQLQEAIGDPGRFLNRVYSRDLRPHFPNLVVAGSGRNDLMKADRQLIEILRLLTARSGDPSPLVNESLVVEQIMRDYELLARFSNDAKFIESVESGEKRATVQSMVERYLENFRLNGIVNFMTTVVPAIVIRSAFEEWMSKAEIYMNEAFESGERSLEQYWARNAERIWGTTLIVDARNRSGGGGTPSQGGPVQGPVTPVGGSGNDPAPQAKAVITDDLEATNEVSTTPQQAQFFWASQQPILPPAMRNDIAVQTYHFNIAPAANMMPVMMMPMIGGLKILPN